MKREIAKAIIFSARVLGLQVELLMGYDGYSGRGMFGEKTTAVVGTRGDIIQCLVHAAFVAGKQDLDEDFIKGLNLRWDSMGLDQVAY